MKAQNLSILTSYYLFLSSEYLLALYHGVRCYINGCKLRRKIIFSLFLLFLPIKLSPNLLIYYTDLHPSNIPLQNEHTFGRGKFGRIL